MSLAKSVGLPWREAKLELRADVFNVVNRPNFQAANGNRSSPAFGTITTTFDPRLVQLGVKLSF